MRPSEDIDKVKMAMEKVLSGRIEVRDAGQNRYLIRLSSDERASLAKLKMIIQRDRIRSAARAVLYRGTHGEVLEVFLNKQVAFAGHVSFTEPEGESPLGPIKLVIRSDKLGEIVDWLTSGK